MWTFVRSTWLAGVASIISLKVMTNCLFVSLALYVADEAVGGVVSAV